MNACVRRVVRAGLICTSIVTGSIPIAGAQSPPPLLDAWGEAGTIAGHLDAPLRMDAPDPWTSEHAGWVLVVDGSEGARRVQRFTSEGNFDRVYENALVDPVAATFVESEWLALPGGRIAVLDAGADEVRVLDAASGALLDQWSVPPVDDGDLDFDPNDGTFWVCLTTQHAVQQYSFTGQLLRTIGVLGVPGSGPQRLHSPRSVEAQQIIVVADTGNDRVVTFWWDAAEQLNWATGGNTGSGPGEFLSPWSATADCRSRILVADRGNARVQRMILVDGDPDPLVFAPTLVLDEVWFDDGVSFDDLVDLVDPSGSVSVVGLPDAPTAGDVGGPAVTGLFALDRVAARVARYDDDCCLGPPIVDVESAGGDLLVSPAATGPTIASIGATVIVTITDACGDPIVGVPAQDAWLDDEGSGTFRACAAGAHADANSDQQGRLFFSGALSAGGSTEIGLRVNLLGSAVGAVLPFRVVSPDFDGSLLVNLVDFGLFARSYGGTYEFRFDLDFDGTISLPDFALFARHLGESCP